MSIASIRACDPRVSARLSDPAFVAARLAAKWDKSDRKRVYECVEAEPWSGAGEIAEELGLPLATVSSHLAAMWRDGRLERKRAGNAYVYRVAA